MKKSIILIACFLITVQLYASYGCGGTLDGLTKGSDLVIIGTIEENKLDIVKTKENSFLININIQQEIKGKSKHKQVQAFVPFNFDIKAINQVHILFFLRTHKLDTSKYLTDNCWIINLSNSDNDIRLKRIKEFVQIDEISHNKKRRKKTIEWYLKCMINDTTRYTGITGFSVMGPFYEFDSKTNKYKRKKKYKLSKSQKKQLRLYFLDKLNFEYNDVFIVGLIRKRKDPEILNKLIEQLNLYDKTDEFYNISNRVWFREFNIMQEILNFTDDPELNRIYEYIKKIGFYSPSQEIQKLTFEFIQRIKVM
ncbi:MAG: hypothetical protein H6571_09240 [Lewinellaceae bacterium]|nr:hypothetical protein [Lewinellaceae bacterium]